jgi:hypothetical protein
MRRAKISRRKESPGSTKKFEHENLDGQPALYNTTHNT